MKSPMLLWGVLAEELGRHSGVDTTRDRRTVAFRFEHEGEAFFMTTLPAFRKAFEQSLEAGRWASDVATGFSRHQGLPRFLGGFLSLVFDRRNGVLLDSPDIDAVRAIRQLCGLYGSVFEVCDEVHVRRAFRSYVETDSEVAQLTFSERDVSDLQHAMATVFGSCLQKIDLDIYSGRVFPRHSNGATAERLRGNQKWTFPEWTDRLETVFPFLDYCVPNHRLGSERILADSDGFSVRWRPLDGELPVRVIAVPKTHDKPRIISIEPSYMQYMQQGLARLFMDSFESHKPFSQVVRLREREHNQRAAQQGSVDRSLATLDLKDASDRLSWVLVQRVFARWPWLVRALDATRSRTALVDGIGQMPLAKFASMGSGLTFPIQTLVFTAIVCVGLARAHNTSPSRFYHDWAHSVRVFGDDIVVPTDAVEHVISALESYGLKVNSQKSFWKGNFRESCGGDYFHGQDVSYVKVKSRFPETRADANEVASLVSLRNRFYTYGLWDTASFLDSWLVELLRHYPLVKEETPMLGRFTYLPVEGEKLHARYQRPISRGYTLKSEIPKDPIDGVPALMRWFTEAENSSEPDPDRPLAAKLVLAGDRFAASGRSKRDTLKLGWYPVD